MSQEKKDRDYVLRLRENIHEMQLRIQELKEFAPFAAKFECLSPEEFKFRDGRQIGYCNGKCTPCSARIRLKMSALSKRSLIAQEK